MEIICDDTIAAIATPRGYGGIGIIRVSGPKSRFVSMQLFRRTYCGSGIQSSITLTPSRLTHGFIAEPGGSPVDEVFCVFFEAPHTYTREDIFEIQSHGGPAVQSKILSLVLACDVRLAEPGEFTRRAFVNGRIDLSQAEAVAEIINAKSEAGLQLAARQLGGQTRQFIESVIQRLNQLIAALQAGLEFGEELEDENALNVQAHELLTEVVQPIQKACANAVAGHYFREGMKLGIIGRPNVGKSSLLNRLIDNDKAIVTQFPGTTRDLIEDYFVVDGMPIVITDTAGLHLSEDPIEKIGIEKTKEYMKRSDMVLFLMDASQPFIAHDAEVLQQIPTQPVLLVLNKIDKNPLHENYLIPQSFSGYPIAHVSALTGSGIEQLKKLLADQCERLTRMQDCGQVVPNLRQKVGLEAALVELERAYVGLKESLSEEFIVHDLIRAKASLTKVVGDQSQEDVLDYIFGQFCIGK